MGVLVSVEVRVEVAVGVRRVEVTVCGSWQILKALKMSAKRR